ncbi:hypothetical protein NONI108955_32745 [Nocardia ninae]|uniref:Uncharacterized protein n=1 Tax=Nocardia ninae NBRC 108245 TaxID=1210091 RepID=A0A511MBJ5_9NOCA|nr:hypothetical protein [Nocardia ninae]GEM38034.1 hypothetical protein NN4_25530 [Nocardia ninae NBRC 108245]
MTNRYTAEQLRVLLERGADSTNSITDRIAIHVLHRAGLLGKQFLGNYISIETVAQGGDQVRLAFIRDWSALADQDERLSRTERRCLELAACIALSVPHPATTGKVTPATPLKMHVCTQN